MMILQVTWNWLSEQGKNRLNNAYLLLCDRIQCLTQFKFIVEEDVALPIDPAFWDYLMGSSQIQWGLTVYEQDWLFSQFMKTKSLQVSLPHAVKH